MADDLHTRLLAATSALTVAEERTPEELAAALRAVVERHAPKPGFSRCTGCSEMYPCPDIRLIADQLGLTEGTDRG